MSSFDKEGFFNSGVSYGVVAKIAIFVKLMIHFLGPSSIFSGFFAMLFYVICEELSGF